MSDETRSIAIRFSEEQEQLLEVAAGFAADKFPLSKARPRIAAAEDFDAGLWHEMVTLGWTGIAIPEEFGGSGLSLAEVVAVVEPLARQLAGTPLVSTTLTAQALVKAGSEAQKSAWLPKLAQGAVGTLALVEPHGDWDLGNLVCKAERRDGALVLSGVKVFVCDAASADVAIASVALDGRPALVLLDKDDLAKAKPAREIVIDETRRSYRLTLDGIRLAPERLLDQAAAAECLRHIDMAACLLLAAEMCGGANGVIDVIVGYLTTRKQFGKLIGSYQALKHPTVDALLAYEAARSHLYHAAGSFDESRESEIAVRMAKAQACDALAFASDRAIQFHGGFGFTYDCDAQLYRRRGLWCETQHGDAAYHRAKLADLLLGE